MTDPSSAHRYAGHLRRNPTFAALSAAFALASPTAMATNFWTIDSCADDINSGDLIAHTGTLRFTVAHAASGDLISTSLDLGCSLISLQTGAITVSQNDLEIRGPSNGGLAITGKYETADRIFRHTGTGTLELRHLTMTGGQVYSAAGYARGGCVFSAGSVVFNDVNAVYCTATTNTGRALGGAVYTADGLSLQNGSVLRKNMVDGGFSGGAFGGGGYVKGALLLEYSTIADNSAFSDGSGGGVGGIAGGLVGLGSVSIKGSTVSGNSAKDYIGGLSFNNSGQSTGNVVSIINSTISGNSAGFAVGGLSTDAGTVEIRNSTFAFNTALKANIQQFVAAVGLDLVEPSPSATTIIESSILSNNTYENGTKENDLGTSSYTLVIGGSHNLVGKSFADLPLGTITGSCPLLAPLRDNGGLTKTHALNSGSPAIDAGSDSGKSNDQRGTSSINGTVNYPRVSGPSADIGAYEVQKADIVFSAGFDGCT